MKRRAWGFAAAALISVSGAPALAQTSVGAGCVGSVDANGTFTSAKQGGCDPSSPSSTSPGPAFTPAEQMQLNAAHDLGAAIGSAFVNWLLAPSPNRDPASQQRALERARQRYQDERQQREQERARQHEENANVAGSLRGLGGSHELQAKGLGNAGSAPGEMQDFVAPPQSPLALQHQAQAIDCAMAEIYAAAKGMGAEGQQFADDLRDQVLDAEMQLETAFDTSWRAKADDDLEHHGVMDFNLLHEAETRKKFTDGTQLIAHGGIDRDLRTGVTSINIDYELNRNGKKVKLDHASVTIDRLGAVGCQEVSKDTAGCMARFNPRSADPSYCPRPPINCKTAKDAVARRELGCS